MKAICVDDEKYVLADLMQICQQIDLIDELHGFRNSVEAIEYLKSNEVDVAFLDIDMPDIKGLELAKMIKVLQPSINIVFTTGYSQYAVEAFKTRASGYLLKPVKKEDIEAELKEIQKKGVVKPSTEKRIVIKTFGNFDIFIDDKLVQFPRKKSKELLAYLVDRQGSSVTRKEIASILFEDEEYSRSNQSYITKIISTLIDTLNEYKAGDLILHSQDSYAINKEMFICDAYEYLAGSNDYPYLGEYMMQYTWAEGRLENY